MILVTGTPPASPPSPIDELTEDLIGGMKRLFLEEIGRREMEQQRSLEAEREPEKGRQKDKDCGLEP